MQSFEELVAQADAADVTGWGFEWLHGRATEERPPWGYARQLAERLGRVRSALDIDTGGGEILAQVPVLPPTMVVTEGWPPNARQARERLGPRGVVVVEMRSEPTDDDAQRHWPLPAAAFELVSSRHPVAPNWPEIHRVLAPDGRYFAQHVGPASAFELIEFFLGPLPEHRTGRDPALETAAAEAAGLVIEDLQTARCRMEFFDVGAIVWVLRKCVWWVPGFTVDAYEPQLRELDEQLRAGSPFVAHSTRHLIEARRA